MPHLYFEAQGFEQSPTFAEVIVVGWVDLVWDV